ncbi:MAG: tetratricopeptide repeat protein [Desulfobacca sp.]|nr:tetratricopeptide repeat protein [Desulfobacca sp.]
MPRLSLPVLALGVQVFFVLLILAAPASAQPGSPAQAWQDYDRALQLIRAGQNQEALPLLERALMILPDNVHLKADYLVCLVWTGAYDAAIAYYRRHRAELQPVRYVPSNIAKAFYEKRDFAQAKSLYSLARTYDPADAEAFKGFIYSCCRLRDFLSAYQAWEEGRKRRLIPAETVNYMEVFLLARLGASSQAQHVAVAQGVKDPELLASVTGDQAVERLQWEEVDLAIQILARQLAQNPENYRARSDYLVALRQKDRMAEVLEQYALLERAGQPTPYWATEAVADAYLYLKRPEQAVTFYELTLEKNPSEPFKPRMGLYSCYVELGQWDRAAEMLARLAEQLAQTQRLVKDKKAPVLLHKRYIDDKQSLVNNQGWFLAYQDKLRQAQEHFEAALQEAGLNTAFRSGLAQVYLWRQWPRRALEEFQVVKTIDPLDKGALVGQAWTLNTLNMKNQARALARQLYARYPTNLHIQNLMDTFRVEDSLFFSPEIYFTKEFQGATEYYAVGSLEVPYSPTFKLYTQIVRQYISSEFDRGESLEFSWDRLNWGYDWIIHPELAWRQAITFDYTRGRDLGSFTQLRWWPTDPLTIIAEFDSFSLNVPIRARAEGMRAKTGLLALRYVASDLLEGSLSFGVNWFSDDNLNPSATLRINRQVINHPEVKLWLGTEINYLRYTDQDVSYFSPLYSYAVLFTPTVHWIHHQRYDTKWRSSFYPRGGIVKEHKESVYPVAGITYEQLFNLSKTFGLTWNVSYDLRVYTGEYTHVLGTYFTFRKYF